MNGLLLKNGMGKPYHAFTDGRLSCVVENYGGINSVSFIDILEKGGKLYPDRNPTPVFSRKLNQSLGRPLYSPAIRFLNQTREGRIAGFYPDRIELFPWGFRSSSEEGKYDLLIDGNRIICDFAPARFDCEKFIVSISKLHLAKADNLHSMKNQIIDHEDGTEVIWRDAKSYGDNVPLDFPCVDEKYSLIWEDAVFKDNFLIFKGKAAFKSGTKEIYCVITSSLKTVLAEPTNLWTMCGACNLKNKLTVSIGLGNTLKDAKNEAVDALHDSGTIWRRKLKNANVISSNTPAIAIDKMPIVPEFARQIAVYQDAATLAETDKGMCIRAAADKYGYFAMWDHVYPIRGFLLDNRQAEAEKLYRYMLDFPHVQLKTYVSIQMIVALNEMRAFAEDRELVRESWPYFKSYFETALKFVDKRNGFLSSSFSCGCDNVREFGLSNLFNAPCINGWWYIACRIIENMAIEFGEAQIAKTAKDISDKINMNFMPTFYVDKDQYLKQGDTAKVNVYLTTSTIGMDYFLGEYLFRGRIRELAKYQANKLYYSTGHVTVAYDSNVVCEMWKAVHMNQHLSHECRLARHANMADEAYRVVNGYLKFFDRYKTAIETFNLSGCEGDEIQISNWQTFAATSTEQAIYRAAGIEYHRGGIVYVPAQDDKKVEVNNIANNKRKFNLKFSGEGDFVKTFKVNGKAVRGTMQIPFDLLKRGVNILEIVRSNTPFGRPTLYSAVDIPILKLSSRKDELSFFIGANIHAPIKIHVPSKPIIELNGKSIDFEYLEPFCFVDSIYQKGDCLKVRI